MSENIWIAITSGLLAIIGAGMLGLGTVAARLLWLLWQAIVALNKRIGLLDGSVGGLRGMLEAHERRITTLEARHKRCESDP